MTTILIGAVGLFTVLIALRAIALAFRQGTFRAREHRLPWRGNHPVIFWANVAGIAVIGAVGLALIGWALSGLR